MHDGAKFVTTPDILNDYPYVVRLYEKNRGRLGKFLCSGLALGAKHVLTCKHDVENCWRELISKDCYGGQASVVNATFDDEIDLGLLELRSPISVPPDLKRPPNVTPILYQLDQSFWNPLGQTEFWALGGKDEQATLTVGLKTVQFSSDKTGSDIQLDGGFKEGYSGGPVIVRHGSKWMCIAIARLGGDVKASSQIVSSDAVYRFLKSIRPELLEGEAVQFVDFRSQTPTLEAACRAVLQEYNRKCVADWERDKPERFVEPRLAIRKRDTQVLDRSDRMQDHDSLLSKKEKEQPGGEIAVEQYRRLLTQRPKKPGAHARVCVTEDAGSGKSIFTQHLRAILASESGQATFFNGEPGLVVRWEGREQSWPVNLRQGLVDVLEREAPETCQFHGVTAKQVVDDAFKHGRVCLILDALDQVTKTVAKNGDSIDRSVLLNSIFEFVNHGEGQQCHVVMTGRSYAVTQEGDGERFPSDTWIFATLEGFDEGQQRKYFDDFVQGRKLSDFIPSYREVSELLAVPVILSLIAEIAKEQGRPPNQVCMENFKTRGDVYREAHKKLADGAKRKYQILETLSERKRFEAILSAAAFAMMCDEQHRRNYAVAGEDAVSQFRLETDSWAKATNGNPLQITDKDWDQLVLFSELTHHASVESCETYITGWKHRGWMEYFAGLYLARYAPPEAAAHMGQFANDPNWYWTWRFAIETPDTIAFTSVRTPVLANLFRRSSSGRRPNELIYRACLMLESTNQDCDALDRFDSEFCDLLNSTSAEDRAWAREIDSSFKRCPDKPSLDHIPFMMGASGSDTDAHSDERPQIKISVVPFLMSDAPTTKRQYWLYDPGHRDDPAFAEELRQYSLTDDCPVNFVTWYDAWCYARWCKSRLPTEVEWEYACRAGTTDRYWWGDKMDASRCTFKKVSTTPASLAHKNEWELMDMSGNVYEWCDTWYVSELARLADSQFTSEFRVVRGGSFDRYSPQPLRSSDRGRDSPGSRDVSIGFRVSRTRNGL